ncbi:MAG: hypothetical protein ACREJQ_05480, partial [bacterium]
MKKVLVLMTILGAAMLFSRPPAAIADEKVMAAACGESISTEDFLLFMFQEQTGPVPQSVPFVAYMFDRMLVRKILVSAAAQAGLDVTDADVQKFIETHKDQY